MSTVAGVVRERLVITGVVQGVGFRPYVATLAASLGLAGSCHNDSTSVVAEVEGPAAAVAEFETRVAAEAPPLARIRSVAASPVAATGASGFVIEASDSVVGGAGVRTMVPPDAATCEACLAELRDPANRRYRHPFITCTHCGPRFTITLDLPYDRPATTMAGFPMCPACAAEYADPTDRRYHAQPISCPDCGPTLTFAEGSPRPGEGSRSPGEESPGPGEESRSSGEGSPGPGEGSRSSGEGSPGPAEESACHGTSAIEAARKALLDGRIVAVKGIGGYHLVCDATNDDAVRRLRERKHRPHQPFAVMVATLDDARRLAQVPEGAEPLLTGTGRPIVLLPARGGVSDAVAPSLAELGVMLPYTPLHHLLTEDMPPLVMTSGNRSGEPLAYRDDDALDRLAGIADAFLTHDRPIAVPCDDSVVAWSSEGPLPVRRSRGYAPLDVELLARPGDPSPGHADSSARPADPSPGRGDPSAVFAAGSELKNTFAVVRDGQAFLSGHLGDLGDLAGRAAYTTASDQMLRFHRAAPDLVVADLHPGYSSRAWAADFAAGLGMPLHLVQHHHAHLASLAAEHGRLDDDLVGLVLDGTGYGCDGGIWGGELLRLGQGGTTAERLGHLAELPLPGGDTGVRNPVRIAAAALTAAGVSIDGTTLERELTDPERTLYGAPNEWPMTSSAGRLFDIVSALLGVRGRISYEAQAAVELEHLSRRGRATDPLPQAPLAGGVLDTTVWLRALAERIDEDPAALGRAFHEALADGLARMVGGASTVGLSGGVFVNRLLLALLTRRLRADGVEVLTHHVVPPGDGGLSLGQAAIGHQLLQRGGSSCA